VGRDCSDAEDCLDDPELDHQHRHLLAVALKWHRHQLTRLQEDHAATHRRLEEVQRSLNDHLAEAAPALELIRRHEKTFDQANTVFKIAFCRTWQAVAAALATWLVAVEIAEHFGWLH
jgi:hypothetical protein